MSENAGPVTPLRERYEITDSIEHLGRSGAMFAAYGYERGSGREVFIKMKGSDPTGNTQLRVNREANHLDSLDHPQIPRLIEAEPFIKNPYIVTERMPGDSGPEFWLKDNTNYIGAAHLCLSALQVLGYVHESNIMHRDVKEANLVMQWSGRVSLVDFELALNGEQRQARESQSSEVMPVGARITSTGKFAGTASHAAPEQIVDNEITEQSDIYAMGITMYRLTYGHLPFEGSTEEVLKRRSTQAINFYSPDRQVPSALRVIIEKATQDYPKDRYTSVAEMAEDTQKYLLSEGALSTVPEFIIA